MFKFTLIQNTQMTQEIMTKAMIPEDKIVQLRYKLIKEELI